MFLAIAVAINNHCAVTVACAEKETFSNKLLHHSPKFSCFVKRWAVSDWENAQETFTTSEIVITYGSIVFLTCRVENVDLCIFSIKYNLFSVAICFGRLVVFNKLRKHLAVVGTELDKQYLKRKHEQHHVCRNGLYLVSNIWVGQVFSSRDNERTHSWAVSMTFKSKSSYRAT